MRYFRRWPSTDEAGLPWLIGGLGGLLGLAFVVETAVFSGLRPELILTADVLVGFLTTAPFVFGLCYGGYWLHRSSLAPTRYERAAIWCSGGALVSLVFNLVVMTVLTPAELWAIVAWIRNSIAMGAASGLFIGVIEARAIEHALDAERATIRAEHLAGQREWLDYLNGLLRHEVLNTSQVIDGYSTMLLDEGDHDAETTQHLEVIRRQSEDMATTIEDVRVLIEATRGAHRIRRLDLVDLLEDELQDLCDTYGPVDVEADLPESVEVMADELLPRVFGNLFTNAVEHNDGPDPRVDVTVETTDGTVCVHVSDDGPGVPETKRDSLFERTRNVHSDHGLGLYLVDQLVARYGGTVELADTGPEGSVFTVELPVAEAAERGPFGTGPDPADPRAPVEKPGGGGRWRGDDPFPMAEPDRDPQSKS